MSAKEMLAIETGVFVQDEVPPQGSDGSTTKEALQQFVRDPLLYISRWYNASMNPRWSTSKEEPSAHAHSETEAAPAVQCTTPHDSARRCSPEAPLRLYANAESCRSSLRAGTASIVLQRRGEGGVHFLNLPVSSVT